MGSVKSPLARAVNLLGIHYSLPSLMPPARPRVSMEPENSRSGLIKNRCEKAGLVKDGHRIPEFRYEGDRIPRRKTKARNK